MAEESIITSDEPQVVDPLKTASKVLPEDHVKIMQLCAEEQMLLERGKRLKAEQEAAHEVVKRVKAEGANLMAEMQGILERRMKLNLELSEKYGIDFRKGGDVNGTTAEIVRKIPTAEA